MRLLVAGVMLLGACAPRPVVITLPPPSPPGACAPDNCRFLLGRAYDEALAREAKTWTGSTVVRAVRPGEMVTMDFRADRLTLKLDEAGKVASASCG